MEKFSEIGIEVQTGTAVEAIERTGSGLRVRARAKSREIAIDADLVVHAAGRAPDLDALNLAAAGVGVEHGRIVLNEFLQSVSNQKVYAAGDAARSGPPLTPVSSHDGKIIAVNLLDGNRHKPDYRGVPTVAFTIPPIAVSEAEAKAQIPHKLGKNFRLVHSLTAQ